MKRWEDLTRSGRRRRLRSAALAALGSYAIEHERLHLLTADTNAVYRVDAADGGRYVLRVGRGGATGHSVEQVRSELGWLEALAADLPARAPEPVAAADGNLLVRVSHPGIPEERTCVLFRWIPGTMLAGHLDEPALEGYGSLAAGLHEHALAYRPPAGAGPLRWDRLFPFDEPVVVFDEDTLPGSLRSQLREAAQLVSEAIAGLQRVEPMRLIHGDLHVWNVLRHRHEATAIDFEDHMWGWPAQDLGVALYYLQLRPGFAEMLASFRRGYERVADWPGDDLVATFMAGRTLVLANDVALLAAEGEEGLDAAAFFERSERRLRAILGGHPFSA